MDKLVPTSQPLSTCVSAALRYQGCEIDADASERIGASVVKVPCEVYSRIVGYMRPVKAWNAGKRQEFVERKTFDTKGYL
jgi:anaerobic ribonucleoside-triphosphate reductase